MEEEKESVLISPNDEFGGFGDELDEFGGFDLSLELEQREEPTQHKEESTAEVSSDAPKSPETASEPSVSANEGSSVPENANLAQEASRPAQGASGVPSLKKRAKKPLSKREKTLRVMLRRAGLEKLPPLEQLMRCKNGQKMAILDIGLFVGEPEDAMLKDLALKCQVENRVNLSAGITRNRVVTVGADILRKGRMFQPIQVARIEEDGALECTSGRHRLAFLAMAYGASTEIPVYIEDMTINEARDAVVVANQARPTKALERAEHAVMKAVGGNVEAEQDELYEKTVTTKARAKKYCVYSVIDRGHPISLGFSVSVTSSRKDGRLTTLTNVENFWGAALEWSKETSRCDFDASLEQSIVFLNKLVQAMQSRQGFDPIHHLAAMTMSAIGKYYRSYGEITGKSAMDVVDDIAEAIVKMGEVGRRKSDEIYNMLTQVMRG